MKIGEVLHKFWTFACYTTVELEKKLLYDQGVNHMVMIAADLAFMFLLFAMWGIAGSRIGRLASHSKKSVLQFKARRQLVSLRIGLWLAWAK